MLKIKANGTVQKRKVRSEIEAHAKIEQHSDAKNDTDKVRVSKRHADDDAPEEAVKKGRVVSEKILESNPNRFVIFPIKYDALWNHYKEMVKCFWTPEEINFTKDMSDWRSLTENEQHFIKQVLAFFAGSDGIVMENLAQRFMNEIQIPEARQCYSFQIMIEGIHSETYSLMIDNYVKDEAEKERLLKAVETIPCVAKKAKWAQKWIAADKSFAERMVAFAVVEGVFFSGSFCAIYWLKQRGKMPGLTFSNELISRDEGQHTDLAILILHELQTLPTEQTVHAIFKEAVEIEKEFITESIPCNLLGMSSVLMSQYIEFVADRLLVQMGYARIWNTKNPFPWMEMISLSGKTNFFEGRVSQYVKSNVGMSELDNAVSTDHNNDF